MFSNYYEVRDWLEGFIPLVYRKENLGLAKIEYLLKILGRPQDKFKSIHVAGTSGKGSTAFYTAKLLGRGLAVKGDEARIVRGKAVEIKDARRSTLNETSIATDKRYPKIGLHVSPHLVDIRERMQIFKHSVIPATACRIKLQRWRKAGIQKSANDWILDQVENDNTIMPMGRFLRLMSEIRLVVEKIQKTKSELAPSYFEILVAASFKYFAEEKVDWAVVEVGLGGRLDATNVLQPKISVITNIGLDHTEILGKTVEKIAEEKAGIIRGTKGQRDKVEEDIEKGVPVVTAATGKALKVIEKVAKNKGSKVIKVNTQKLAKELSMKHFSDGPFLAYEVLRQLKIPIKKELAKTFFLEKFPGRFEEIDQNIIIDGAHNSDKIRALISWIQDRSTVYRLQTTAVDSRQWTVVLVIAFKKGKNWKKMIDLLIKNLPIKKVIATKFWASTDMGKYQAVEPREIAKYVSSIKYPVLSIKVVHNSQEGVFEAIQNTKYEIPNTSLVLVTGSLYLVGEVRTMWKLPQF